MVYVRGSESRSKGKVRHFTLRGLRTGRHEYYRSDGQCGLVYYYSHGRLHREDGPAVVRYTQGGDVDHVSYYYRGRAHRDEGPSCVWYVGGKVSREEYYRHGEHLSPIG